MRLLVDTHIVIWTLTNSKKKISPTIIEALQSSQNTSFVSIASLWEIAIKHSLGKLDLGMNLDTLFKLIENSGFEILPIQPLEIIALSQLPFHHSDPFDRILIAQSVHNGLKLISKDSIFDQYQVELLK